jgi:hypothetical protein
MNYQSESAFRLLQLNVCGDIDSVYEADLLTSQ